MDSSAPRWNPAGEASCPGWEKEKFYAEHQGVNNGTGKLGSGERFAKLKGKLAKQGVSDPGALAASIGRKKYGKAKMQKMAAKGKPGY